MFNDFYRNKRVLVTGHTGFKGSWLCECLLELGAQVHGYALDPQPHERLFDQLGLAPRLASDTRADLADRERLAGKVLAIRPDCVFHLAAQPLVRLSYDLPVETFAANLMGTVHVLDSLRALQSAGFGCAAVMVTTDKCYANREWLHGYREEDPMGGHDPYSASKGCAELAIAAYRQSYFSSSSHNPQSSIHIASARAGNVIGGGDWGQDRIVPDCIRALRAGKSIPVRNKTATRPWQHVLEPLSGYLWLAASLSTNLRPLTSDMCPLASAFNFGPARDSNTTVAQLVQELLKHTGGEWFDASDPDAVHESSQLNLAIDKAFHLLQWQPTWGFEEALAKTAEWYIGEANAENVHAITRRQILEYAQAAALKDISWAKFSSRGSP